MQEENFNWIALIIATIISLVVGFILRKCDLEIKEKDSKDSMASVPYISASILVFFIIFNLVNYLPQ